VADPLRARRDAYDLADPHLRTWLAVISPHRSDLQAGRAREVWRSVRTTTWRTQVLGPRWEAVARSHVAGGGVPGLGPGLTVGASTVADRAQRTSHEVDIVVTRCRDVVALGEAKLRRLGRGDLDRLRRVRELLGAAGARLILASAAGVDDDTGDDDVVALVPADVYG
jgi:hypothetical protein